MRCLAILILFISVNDVSAQLEPSGVNDDRLVDAGIEIERFATQQKTASILYVMGATLNIAAITLINSQPQVAVGVSIAGGVLGVSGWVVDRSSYSHIETAGRLLTRVPIPLSKPGSTYSENRKILDSTRTAQRDSVVQQVLSQDSMLQLIELEMDSYQLNIVADCQADLLPKSFCNDFDNIHEELSRLIRDARLEAQPKKTILNQVKMIEREVNTHLSDLYFSSSREREHAQLYRTVISRLKTHLY